MREPQILLLDEPLSNLDAKLREQMRVELKRLQKSLGITTVYVTHDQSEALALSDEIAVFNAARSSSAAPRRTSTATPEPVRRRLHRLSELHQRQVREATDVDGARRWSRPPHGLFRCIFAQAVTPGQAVLVSARPEDLRPSRTIRRRRLQRAGRQRSRTACSSARWSTIWWTREQDGNPCAHQARARFQHRAVRACQRLAGQMRVPAIVGRPGGA